MAYLPLSTANLPDPVIDPAQGSSPEDYFGIVTTTISSSTGSISGYNFQPDWVWRKRRDASQNHGLYDAVRGGDRELVSNSTSAENTNANLITAFNSDGFDYGGSMFSLAPYVIWAWKANGSGVSNTVGSIPSTVSANTESGFSIVSYTGGGSAGTIGHGLSFEPEMLIVKRTDGGTGGWYVYHHKSDASIPQNKYFELQGTGAVADASWPWNDTSPTSSVFSVGSDINISGNGNTFIAYCFHSVEGFSKAFSYTGNGSADGVFVHLGFKPAFIMTKRTDSTGDWHMYDAERDEYNVVYKAIWANYSSAEYLNYNNVWDFLSNGVKARTSSVITNASGATYIGIAFAENPFKYSTAR